MEHFQVYNNQTQWHIYEINRWWQGWKPRWSHQLSWWDWKPFSKRDIACRKLTNVVYLFISLKFCNKCLLANTELFWPGKISWQAIKFEVTSHWSWTVAKQKTLVVRKMFRVQRFPTMARRDGTSYTLLNCDHGRRKGVLGPLDFEIWYFAVKVTIKKCFSLSFGKGKVKFFDLWFPWKKSFWPPPENIHICPPLEKILPMPMTCYWPCT